MDELAGAGERRTESAGVPAQAQGNGHRPDGQKATGNGMSYPNLRGQAAPLCCLQTPVQDLQQLFSMLDHNQNSTVDPDEFKRTLARWAFDSKTATRFVRYTLQQLMDDHSSAAEKLSKMESFPGKVQACP